MKRTQLQYPSPASGIQIPLAETLPGAEKNEKGTGRGWHYAPEITCKVSLCIWNLLRLLTPQLLLHFSGSFSKDSGWEHMKFPWCLLGRVSDLKYSRNIKNFSYCEAKKCTKGVCQGCILSPCLFNFYAEYIVRSAGLAEITSEIKIARRNINNLRYADNTTLMAWSEEELKSLLMRVKEEEWKSWLKTQHSQN